MEFISKALQSFYRSGFRITFGVFSLFFIIFISNDSAEAYLDPSIGGQLFQLLAAGILGALFTLKLYFRKLKSLLKKMFQGETGNENDKNT